jgi:hypothetical protein
MTQKNDLKQELTSAGWLLQCPPGLANILKKEMVFAGAIKRDQQLFIKKQRNHDLVFANHVKSEGGMSHLRIAESVLRCPVYGRYKVSQRQLELMAKELKALGPRRLVVSVAGRVFQRQDLSRWLTKELATRGYEFDTEIEEEVWMFCIDESWYFGLPIKKGRETEGREDRVAERQGSLPPAIAAAMAFSGMPRPDDVIFDPVCGSGTLLSECHAYSPEAQYWGGDIDPKAVSIAKKNLRQIENLKLLTGDSQRTGLDDINVSLVLANLPFGQQFGDKTTNPKIYAGLFEEQLRLRDQSLPKQGKSWRAIVLTSDIESLQTALQAFPGLSMENLFKVKIRGELAFAYRLKMSKG